MSSRDQMADLLASALPENNVRAWDDHGNPISMKMLSSFVAEQLRDQGWLLVRAPLVPLPTSDDTTFTEQADYGSDAR